LLQSDYTRQQLIRRHALEWTHYFQQLRLRKRYSLEYAEWLPQLDYKLQQVKKHHALDWMQYLQTLRMNTRHALEWDKPNTEDVKNALRWEHFKQVHQLSDQHSREWALLNNKPIQEEMSNEQNERILARVFATLNQEQNNE